MSFEISSLVLLLTSLPKKSWILSGPTLWRMQTKAQMMRWSKRTCQRTFPGLLAVMTVGDRHGAETTAASSGKVHGA